MTCKCNVTQRLDTNVRNGAPKVHAKHSLSVQMRRFHQRPEIVAFLAHLVALLAAFLLGALFDVLLEHLFAFARGQQQVARIEDDFVQLLLPRTEGGNLAKDKMNRVVC